MKTSLNIFTCSILIILLFGCEDDISLNYDTLTGTWRHEKYVEDDNIISRLEYRFKENKEVEILRIELDLPFKKIIRYRYPTLGKYMLDGNKLTFYGLINYSTDDETKDPFIKDEKLQLIPESSQEPYTMECKFENRGKKLVLIPSCPPNANCVGSINLKRD